jgi:hypothetical protein
MLNTTLEYLLNMLIIFFYLTMYSIPIKNYFFSINFIFNFLFYMLNNCPVDIAYTFFIYVCNVFFFYKINRSNFPFIKKNHIIVIEIKKKIHITMNPTFSFATLSEINVPIKMCGWSRICIL